MSGYEASFLGSLPTMLVSLAYKSHLLAGRFISQVGETVSGQVLTGERSPTTPLESRFRGTKTPACRRVLLHVYTNLVSTWVNATKIFRCLQMTVFDALYVSKYGTANRKQAGVTPSPLPSGSQTIDMDKIFLEVQK